MPSNMKRLSTCLASILSAMECPICLDTIPPPACQCLNGHLICAKCHAKSEKCPVCRIRLSRGRSLFADQVYNSLVVSFELSNEGNDKERNEKMNEIFKIRKKSVKNSNHPEIKITHSFTNKFLERLVEKSTSAENLSNQYFLSPDFKSNLSDGFHETMRTKSLSTSEINYPGSPGAILRSGFRVSKTDLVSRMNTCGRSFESLDGNLRNSQSNSASTNNLDDALYFCPFSEECNSLIKGSMVKQHFKKSHDGPLIQYFKSKITFNLLTTHYDTYCISHDTGKYFFLKINYINQDTIDSKPYYQDILISMCLLDDLNGANDFQLQINVYFNSCSDKKLLILNNAVYSLRSVSWKDIKNSQKGVFISKETLKALSLSSNDLMLDVEIKTMR